MNWTILIHDLKLNALIGLLPSELRSPQPILINIRCTYQTLLEPKGFHDVFCYHTLVTEIENLIRDNHFYLLETLAEKIVDLCFDSILVKSVVIRIEKTSILPQTKSVGVEIERHKQCL
jgi:dihydroneopterin aldolase